MKLSYRKYIVAAVLVLAALPAVGQTTLNSAYFTQDYKFRHTMNPAYGNDHGYFSIPALGNLNINLRGNFGYEDIVMSNPLYPSSSTKSLTTFMNPYISTSDALSGFNTNNRLQFDFGMAVLSTGFKGFGGYNTIEVNAKASVGMKLPYGLFEFAKNTGNQRYDIGDISARATSYVEVALGHSHDVNEHLRIGAKVKVLLGAARADLKLQDVTADLSGADQWTISGTGTANVSLKGFTYQTETKSYNDGGTYEQVDDVDVDGAGIGGFGLALDLGAIYKINDDWTVSAAVTDLGFINWTNDVLAQNGGSSFVFDGFHDVSVTTDRGEVIDDKIDSYEDQLKDFAHLEDKGDQGKSTKAIGATVNVGVEYTLPVYRRISFGLLSSTYIDGPYSWTEGRLSANWVPLKWLDGGVNVAVNSFGMGFGWILNIHPKSFSFHIGMDRLLGKLSNEYIPLNSNASLSFGMSIAW